MHRPLSSRVAFLALLASAATLAMAQYPGATPPPDRYKAGYASITSADAREWLAYLAGPETEGRGTGQPGYQKAAEYMAAKFKQFGLKPGGDGDTYFQNLPFSRTRANDAESGLIFGSVKLIGGKDLGFTSVSADAENKGTLVFVRADSAASKLADPKVIEGRIVVLSAPTIGPELRRQLSQGQPAAVLTIGDKISASGWSVRRGAARPGRAGGALRATISESAARQLAESAGIDASFLSSTLGNGEAAVRPATGEATLSAKIETQEVQVPNVVGILEGSDPALRHEHIGIGSHLDHLGVQNGVIYYGADDDGSGSTALLQVAKAFALNPVKPRRSIVFMAFCGEEMGLIGSNYYASNPKYPLADMVCELQMDMVGRNSDGAQNGDRNRMDKADENIDTMRLVGSKRISMELHNLILGVNSHVNFRFKYDSEDVYTRSDHYAFASKGVPVAFTFSGFHPDYHQPTDTIEKINYEKIANTAKLFYLTASTVANKDERLKRDAGGE